MRKTFGTGSFSTLLLAAGLLFYILYRLYDAPVVKTRVSNFLTPADAHVSECATFASFHELPSCDMRAVNHLISNAQSCLQPESHDDKDVIYFHQYLVNTNHSFGIWNSEALSASIKSYIVTQDLNTTKLIIWADLSTIELLLELPVMTTYSQNIIIRYFDYEKEIQGSPLELSEFYSNYTTVLDAMIIDNFSSIVRHLLLWKYGGFYFDNDGKGIAISGH